MDQTRTITSIFMVVALVAMAALAISVSQKSEPEPVPTQELILLPGLAENLLSIEKITAFPADHIRSVRITRTDGEEVAVIRDAPGNGEFSFENTAPESISAFSAILYANAAFMDSLRSDTAIAVTGFADEIVIGQLTYTSFDGLVLKSIVLRAGDATWLRFIAIHSEKLAARYDNSATAALLPADETIEFAHRLNGRIYRQPDE